MMYTPPDATLVGNRALKCTAALARADTDAVTPLCLANATCRQTQHPRGRCQGPPAARCVCVGSAASRDGHTASPPVRL
jgi:hypothetical protein